MQDELVALSRGTVRKTALEAAHNVRLNEPALVVKAICNLVERCRRGAGT